MCFDAANLKREYNKIDRETFKRKQEILNKFKENNALKVRDNIAVDSNLCIILSCPGEEEFIKNKVCAGDTGENIEKIISKISSKVDIRPQYNSDDKNNNEQRYRYSIINSVEDVYFRKYNGAEAEKEDVETDENIKRVESEIRQIKNLEYVIICGENAEIIYQKAVSSINRKIKASKVCHLGWVGLRNQYKNNHEEIQSIKSGKERDNKRLELVAENIVKDFEKIGIQTNTDKKY